MRHIYLLCVNPCGISLSRRRFSSLWNSVLRRRICAVFEKFGVGLETASKISLEETYWFYAEFTHLHKAPFFTCMCSFPGRS